MILELHGTKVTIVDKTLGYQGDNLVNTIQVTVDKDSTWNYKLDMYKGKSKCFDTVLMTREGVQCLLRAEIIRNHDKYMDKDFCPIYAKEALKRAYHAYHELGGNDVATGLYNETMALPTEVKE